MWPAKSFVRFWSESPDSVQPTLDFNLASANLRRGLNCAVVPGTAFPLLCAPMKIRRLQAFRVELPLHEGSYKWSGGKSVTVFDSTIVRVETDAGLAGHGEVCPLGPFYLPAYAD